MSIVHSEPEFRIVLEPHEAQPSIEELTFLRRADVTARDIAILQLKEHIIENGCWITDTLDYSDVSDFSKAIEGSTWRINIETITSRNKIR